MGPVLLRTSVGSPNRGNQRTFVHRAVCTGTEGDGGYECSTTRTRSISPGHHGNNDGRDERFSVGKLFFETKTPIGGKLRRRLFRDGFCFFFLVATNSWTGWRRLRAEYRPTRRLFSYRARFDYTNLAAANEHSTKGIGRGKNETGFAFSTNHIHFPLG